jgi:hypothetical protein
LLKLFEPGSADGIIPLPELIEPPFMAGCKEPASSDEQLLGTHFADRIDLGTGLSYPVSQVL